MSAQPGPIPKAWRLRVVAILREGAKTRIIVRQRALRDWQAIFPDEFFAYSLRDALADALEVNELTGKRYEMDEPGETYGFLFHHRDIQFYGKVNLTEPDQLVIVYSAHCPLMGNELP